MSVVRTSNVDLKVNGAGAYAFLHAFLNPSHGAVNEKAAAEAWPLAINFLKEKLK